MRYAVFHFLGSISYSLYLVHSPIGKRALNLFMRISGAQSTASRLLVIAAATGVSILAAYLLYRFVELPSQTWSARLRYHRKQPRPQLSPEESEQLNPAF